MALVANYRGKASASTGTTTLSLAHSSTSGYHNATMAITVPSGTTYVAIKSITRTGAFGADAAAINGISEAVISGTTATFTVNYWTSAAATGASTFNVEYVYG